MPNRWRTDPLVDRLAGAIADGDAIDWASVDSQLTSSDDHEVANRLRTLSTLASDESRRVRHAGPSPRLPFLLEAARLLAIVRTTIGLLAAVVALYQLHVPRLGAMLAVQATFALVATLLDVAAGDRRTRTLAACLWIMAGSFSAGAIPWLGNRWPQVPGLHTLSVLYPDSFIAAGLWLFARDFPIVKRFSTVDRISTLALRVTLGIGTALFLANVAPGWLPALRPVLAPYQRLLSGGRFWTITFGTALPALVVMAWRARRADRTEARRVRLFLSGIVISVTPTVAEVLLEGLSRTFREAAIRQWWRSVGAWVIYPSMTLLPLLSAYALTVQNVFGLRVVIQRALRYLLARWVITGAGLLPIVLFIMRMYRNASHPLGEVLSQPAAGFELAAAAAAGLLLACRSRLLRIFDRWAAGSAEDPSTVLAQLTTRLKQVRTPLDIARELAGAAERVLRTPAHVYVVRRGALLAASADGDPLPDQSMVPVLLDGSRETCLVGPGNRHSYYSLLLEDDRAWIDRHAIDLLVPVVSGRTGGALRAMIAVEQRTQSPLGSREDLRFLRAAAGAASLACNSVRGDEDEQSAEPEEVALECHDCGAVRPWEQSEGRCACGSDRANPGALPINIDDRFALRQRLGSGGMGVVYRATDVHLGRDVAIKTLSRLSAGAATRLRLEARAMAALTHPHVAVVFGVDNWHDTPLIVMEYLAGGTLAARLRRGPLSVGDGAAVTLALANALVHMHRAGRIHGDIKPSNVGFTADGMVKFLDFGLSRAIITDPAGTSSDRQAGTPAYMSPEMRDGAPAGPEADVWALALVFYESVTAANPFAGAMRSRDIAASMPGALARSPIGEEQALRGLFESALVRVGNRNVRSAVDLISAIESATHT